MNLYQGCLHGCIYCDSRSTCYQIQHDFEDIEIKQDCLVLLKKELKSRRKKGMISTGAMTDPYLALDANCSTCVEVRSLSENMASEAAF